MIFEGLKLMVVGMTTVLLFLTFMILLIQLVSYLTRSAAAREIQAIEDEKARRKRERDEEKMAAAAGDDADIAVISAAIATFEMEKAAIA